MRAVFPKPLPEIGKNLSLRFFLEERKPVMAMRSVAISRASLSRLVEASRRASRNFSDGKGKVLSEEEKAAENIFIQKTEREKLEKLARKGYKPEEQPTATAGATATDAKPSGPSSSTSGVSTDKDRNYAVLAGFIAAAAALGWYLTSSAKKPEEVQD
ncbi:uncharacterized protein At2g27730, mitochondrial [Magnolia sinica]|uniref:uncharacterized protein At2g27730, mitochondrial n=1 Tax=Magnolia sinica TaxID=86752 RepID=UPI00265B48B7|nr:uncharacterized protein At2g27730, mitochondrial [Magnolia sinica]